MRVWLVLIVAAAMTGCSGGPRARAPHVMIARAIPKVVRRLRGDQQPVVAAQQPRTVITGNLVR